MAEVIMTYTKQGDRITLEMTQEEFDDVLEYGKGRGQQMRRQTSCTMVPVASARAWLHLG